MTKYYIFTLFLDKFSFNLPPRSLESRKHSTRFQLSACSNTWTVFLNQKYTFFTQLSSQTILTCAKDNSDPLNQLTIIILIVIFIDSPPIPKTNRPAIIVSKLSIFIPFAVIIYPRVMNPKKDTVIFLYPIVG